MTLWIRLTGTVGVAAAALLSFTGSAGAQLREPEATVPGLETRRLRTLTIPEAFEEAFFEHDRDFFRNRDFDRQLQWIMLSYPENEIARDGELVYELYVDVMRQQTQSDPYLRTPDLINPYTTSLDTLYRTGGNVPVRGSELFLDLP